MYHRLGLSDCVNFSMTIICSKTSQCCVYILIIIKSESDSVNTVKKQWELFIDPLVASCITHLYALVCDNLDVTFGIKATCIM